VSTATPVPGGPTTIPLHSPIFEPTGMADYGGDVEGLLLLLELPEAAVREVLEPTPFEYVASYAWVEVMLYKTVFGIAKYDVSADDPYRCSGFSVPARFGDTVGAYCANYYKNKDFGFAPGREGAGYPVKFADIRYQHTGRAITASVACATARFDASIITGEDSGPVPEEAASSPTLLVQQIPDVEVSGGVLLRQVISRDTSASSRIESERAEGAFELTGAPSGVDDLAWVRDARVVAAQYIAGPMRGTVGKVLSTEYVGDGLRERIQSFTPAVAR
jgi:acetoacetate decarboxylase